MKKCQPTKLPELSRGPFSPRFSPVSSSCRQSFTCSTTATTTSSLAHRYGSRRNSSSQRRPRSITHLQTIHSRLVSPRSAKRSLPITARATPPQPRHSHNERRPAATHQRILPFPQHIWHSRLAHYVHPPALPAAAIALCPTTDSHLQPIRRRPSQA